MRGDIHHHDKLVFHNGVVGTKFLILLNSPQKGEPYLFVKTTSQEKHYPECKGLDCLYSHKCFSVPAKVSFFSKNTWVQLHEIYEFSPIDLLKSKFEKDAGSVVGTLDSQLTNQIVNCLLKCNSEDIIADHIALLKRDKKA